MNKILPIVFLSLFSLQVFAQVNLCPNPSFEDTVGGCPMWGNQVHYCKDWWAAVDTSWSSPDYFHTCSTNPDIQPPDIFSIGYQAPVSGGAYCHLVTYVKALPDYREIIQAQLTTSLTIGQTYYVSFYASRTGETIYKYASNKLGALFTTYKVESPSFFVLNNFAHIYIDSILTDTVNWYHIKGSFVADSTYQYIAIGNFFNGANTDTIKIGSGFASSATYFIDDICVSTDSALCYTPASVQEIKPDDAFMIYPNPANQYFVIKQKQGIVKQGVVYDIMGRGVKRFNVTPASKTIIDCSDWTQGIYLIKTEKFTRKIIILH